MSNPFLQRRVSWTSAMSVIGVQVGAAVLPAHVDCPVCRTARLRVYHDPSLGGQWTYCPGCRRGCDMIELTAIVTGLPLVDVPALLMESQAGLSPADISGDAVAQYVAEVVEPRRQIQKFWAAATERFWSPDSDRLRAIRTEFPEIEEPGGRRNNPQLQLFGLAGRHELAVAAGSKTVTNAPGKRARLRVTGAMLVAHHDLPGRICGFSSMYQTGSGMTSEYVPVRTCKLARQDTGIGMMEAVTEGRLAATPVRVLCRDPLTVTRWQLRYIRANTCPAPVGIYFDGAEGSPLALGDSLALTNVVFWSPTLSGSEVAQAKAARARVSIYRESDTPRNTLDFCRKIAAHACSWQAGLRAFCEIATPPEVCAVVERLSPTPAELRDALATCKPRTAAMIRDALAVRLATRSAEWKGKTFIERDGKWFSSWREGRWARPKEYCVSDAIVRIDRVVHGGGAHPDYVGRVLYRGTEYPFREPGAKLAKLLSWVHAFLRDTVRAGLSLFDKRYDADGLSLSLQFQEPKIVQGLTSIGWDDASQKFNFRDFTIDPHGHVDLAVDAAFGVDAPAGNIVDPPDYIPAHVLRFLNPRNCETEVFWPLFVAAAYNILAPARRLPACPVAVIGVGAATAGSDAARRLGMQRETPNGSRGPHRWPTYIHGKGDPGWEWVNEVRSDHGCGNLVELPWHVGLVVAMRQGWAALDQPRQLGSLQYIPMMAGTLLAHFLRYVCREYLWNFDLQGDDDWVDRTYKEVRTWYRTIGGEPPGPTSGRELFHPPHCDKSRHFGELLRHLCDKRLVTVGEGDPTRNDAPHIVLMPDDAVWVPQTRLSETLLGQGGLPLDTLLVSHTLATAKALRSEATFRGKVGWLLRRDWWDAHVVAPRPEQPSVR